MTDLDALARRLDRLEQTAAVIDVLYQYAYALDYGDEQSFVACFTDDAVWEAHNAVTGGVMRYAGRTELERFAAGHTRPPDLRHKHVIAEPRVGIDAEDATSTCYFALIVGAPGGIPELMTFGRYVDRFVRVGGQWRIAHRRAEADAWHPMWGDLRDSRRRQLEHDVG
jgi:3-phenylpropionate/cinnamic acid dioxygenase small subunit